MLRYTTQPYSLNQQLHCEYSARSRTSNAKSYKTKQRSKLIVRQISLKSAPTPSDITLTLSHKSRTVLRLEWTKSHRDRMGVKPSSSSPACGWGWLCGFALFWRRKKSCKRASITSSVASRCVLIEKQLGETHRSFARWCRQLKPRLDSTRASLAAARKFRVCLLHNLALHLIRLDIIETLAHDEMRSNNTKKKTRTRSTKRWREEKRSPEGLTRNADGKTFAFLAAFIAFISQLAFVRRLFLSFFASLSRFPRCSIWAPTISHKCVWSLGLLGLTYSFPLGCLFLARSRSPEHYVMNEMETARL